MKMNKETFLEGGKAVTLMGMSGVGKTHISLLLSNEGWQFYSCDYEIGTQYLAEDIQNTLEIDEKITVDNLGYLSDFVGQVGDMSLGGLSFEEFKRRQNLYYEAECRSIIDALPLLEKDENTVIDSTGSLCEILDEKIIEALGQKTLFVYLEASETDKVELIRRAQEYPKPLFFPPKKFEGWLTDYLRMNNITGPERMPPNDFSRWVFPKLLASRLPKYEQLAEKYGVTIPAAAFNNLTSADDFSEIIVDYLT